MATTTLPELPVPGTYRIVQYGVQGQPQILTVNKDRNVTITAAGTVPERNQEWTLEITGNKVAIQYPADLRPSSSLSYEGKPEPGKKIKLGLLKDFPTRVWNLEHAPHLPGPFRPYFITVPGEDLRVVISPKAIFPPQLELSHHHYHSHATSWIFELVRPA